MNQKSGTCFNKFREWPFKMENETLWLRGMDWHPCSSIIRDKFTLRWGWLSHNYTGRAKCIGYLQCSFHGKWNKKRLSLRNRVKSRKRELIDFRKRRRRSSLNGSLQESLCQRSLPFLRESNTNSRPRLDSFWISSQTAFTPIKRCFWESSSQIALMPLRSKGMLKYQDKQNKLTLTITSTLLPIYPKELFQYTTLELAWPETK